MVAMKTNSVEVPPAEYIHAYCIYPCIHTNEGHTSTGQCKAVLEYETYMYMVQGYPFTSILNLALMFTSELFLCIHVLVHTLVLISAYLWLLHAPNMVCEYSVGRMTYLPQAVSDYVRTGNVITKPWHEYHFLFSKRTGVLV